MASFRRTFAVQSVGVMGDFRTTRGLLLSVPCVHGRMTADWRGCLTIFARSRRGSRARSALNRVVYDISFQAASTIEWE